MFWPLTSFIINILDLLKICLYFFDTFIIKPKRTPHVYCSIHVLWSDCSETSFTSSNFLSHLGIHLNSCCHVWTTQLENQCDFPELYLCVCPPFCTFPRKRLHERPEKAHTQSVTEKISAFMLHGKKWGQRRLFLQTRRLILNATSSAWSLWRVFWDFIFSRVTMCVSEHKHFGDCGGVGLQNGVLYWTRKRRNWGGGKQNNNNGQGRENELSSTVRARIQIIYDTPIWHVRGQRRRM